MKSPLSIGDVAQRTGLTERALRFYEEQGLIKPARSSAGRRLYGADELTTIHQITVLKSAGFSLSRVKQLIRCARFDGAEIIAAQIEALHSERLVINRALTALGRAKDALATNESLDIESLCDLIYLGERQMKNEALKEYIDKHFTPEEQERWMNAKLKAAGGDPDSYLQRLNDLIQRIQQALPLDPASDSAQAFLAEWNAIQQPFVDALDDEMKAQLNGAPSIPGMEPITEFLTAAKAASLSK